MPQNIATTNEGKPMIAYQGETPWHSLGTKMDGTVDVQAALKAAHLDWTVRLEQMFIKRDEKLVKVPGKRAVVRDSDNRILATVGRQYHPLQNRDAFGVLDTACKEFGVVIETAGALGKGDRVWVLAKMPTSVEPVQGDKVEGYSLFVTGHNGWTPYTARFTDVRVVCQNTLSMATRQSDAFVKLTHVKNNDEALEQVAELVTNFTAALKQQGETYARMANKKMTKDDIRAYVMDVLGLEEGEEVTPVTARRRDKIVELAAAGTGSEFAPGTAWAAFNAITEYVDHVRPVEAKSPRMIKQANQSAIFGTNARLKNKAFVMARRVAA